MSSKQNEADLFRGQNPSIGRNSFPEFPAVQLSADPRAVIRKLHLSNWLGGKCGLCGKLGTENLRSATVLKR